MTVDLDQLADLLITAQRGVVEAFSELQFLREEIARYQSALATLKTEGSAPHDRIRQLEDALRAIMTRAESIQDDDMLAQLKVDLVDQEIRWIESTARDALRRR